jgi:hypothetical protein
MLCLFSKAAMNSHMVAVFPKHFRNSDQSFKATIFMFFRFPAFEIPEQVDDAKSLQECVHACAPACTHTPLMAVSENFIRMRTWRSACGVSKT